MGRLIGSAMVRGRPLRSPLQLPTHTSPRRGCHVRAACWRARSIGCSTAPAWTIVSGGGKSWLAYQHRIGQGVLEHKVTVLTRGDGSEKIVEQVMVTPKGLALLAKRLERTLAA